RSVHQANLVKIRACLAAGHYRPEHKKTDSPGGRGQQRRYTKMDLPPVSTPAPTKPNQTKPQQARIREQKKWAT
ncbi:hypothetical protein, partial [Pseudomonas monteilii]|uniref:hypothetical protein n=1 Tax=Pseudomonas monteilii TaxID=76759 RepID=UPI001E650401